MTIEDKFNEFIASLRLDKEDADFQEYEVCITEFDNQLEKLK
jgi:hypothetical protein